MHSPLKKPTGEGMDKQISAAIAALLEGMQRAAGPFGAGRNSQTG